MLAVDGTGATPALNESMDFNSFEANGSQMDAAPQRNFLDECVACLWLPVVLVLKTDLCLLLPAEHQTAT